MASEHAQRVQGVAMRYDFEPTLEDLKRWHQACNGVIDPAHPWARSLVLAAMPDPADEALTAFSVGPESLTAAMLGTQNVDAVALYTQSMKMAHRWALLRDYAHAGYGKEATITECKSVIDGNTIRYRRLLMQCQLPDGRDAVAVAARAMSKQRAADAKAAPRTAPGYA